MLRGNYVAKFEDASHAIPEGMHMNADYPFKLPTIKSITGKEMIITDKGNETTVTIKNMNGKQVAYVKQSSSLERMFKYKPARFKLHPFKDEKTPAISGQEKLL